LGAKNKKPTLLSFLISKEGKEKRPKSSERFHPQNTKKSTQSAYLGLNYGFVWIELIFAEAEN